jgi:DNA repair exonuclease SbcCD ATPase subunit
MDNKRQEITECQRTERQLEGRVHGLKEERLQLQSQLQKRETLISKKKDLMTQIESLESEVKV